MHNLEGSKFPGPGPDIPGKITGEPSELTEEAGKLKGASVTKKSESNTTEKVDVVAKDDKLKEAREVAKKEIESPRLDAISEKIESFEDKELTLKCIDIVSKGKSMQGYPGEVLPYEGYLLLEKIKQRSGELNSLEKKLVLASGETTNAIVSLKNTLAGADAINGLQPSHVNEIAEAIKAGTATETQVELVVHCKRLWMDISAEEGSYLEILKFAGQPGFEGLALIKQVAFMQGPQVDMMLNKAVLEDHLENRPGMGHPLRVLVEGAGPNGLYASMQFFRSGANVSIVNDRSERTIRSQNMIMDPKWIAQLNFLLGSKFNELFVDSKALGVLNLQRGSGTIKTLVLEDVMKTRVAEISSYVEDSESLQKDAFLNVHFETPVKGIKSTEQGFTAIIGAPKKNQEDVERFKNSAIDSLTVKILNQKYARYRPEDTIGEKTVLSMAREEASAQWEEEQKLAKIEQPMITFDILACVGGANDMVRDEFLEPAVPLTSPKNYGIASWKKPENEADKRYFSQDVLKSLNIQTDKLGYPYLTRAHIEQSLQSQDLDKFIAESKLPDNLKEKYQNFTENLLKNIETSNLPNVDMDQEICGFNIRMFENYSTVFIAESTPPFLADFLHDLAKITTPNNQELKDLKKEIDKRWMNTLAGVFSIDPTIVKLEEETPINLGTFDVVQKVIVTAAKLLESGESSAVIAAFGDSRASPHFFSGSGMSTGRLSIENGAEVIRNYNRGAISSKKELTIMLDEALDPVKDLAIEKGRRFVKPNSETERSAARYRIIKNKIQEHYNSQQRQQPDIKKTGWKLDSEVNEQGEFSLSYMDKSGKQHSLKVKINEEDGLLYSNSKTYPVFNDLLLDLGVA